jgi:ribosomal protein L11 methyltransferase
MVTLSTMVSTMRPKELFVYECEGSHPPVGEPDDRGFLGTWPEPPFYYLFFEQEAGAGLFSWLENQRGWMLRSLFNLAYDQWQQVSTERLQVGPFVIEMQPGVAAPGERGDGIVIRLDPGVVFGSGLHGSTKGSLLAIAHLFARFPINSAVDMGTGTGILAIACGALGAARVLAIDKVPLAIRVARKNILLNGVEDRVKALAAEDLRVLKAPSELLVMNLEWPSLQHLLRGNEWLSYQWIVLSGFLERQWDSLTAHIPPAFHIHHRITIDDWLTVTIARAAPP